MPKLAHGLRDSIAYTLGRAYSLAIPIFWLMLSRGGLIALCDYVLKRIKTA